MTKHFGLKCDKANDGVQEVDLYMANMNKTCCDVRYRLILTDINMPRMDGIEASERILAAQDDLRRANPALPEVMIVAITAHDTQEMFKKCERAGISKCLIKPVKADLLKFAVEYHDRIGEKDDSSSEQRSNNEE